MKTKIWLLTSCMVFSSCYSYKTMDTGTSVISKGKKYKIITADNKNHKIWILKYGDTLIGRKSKSSGTLTKLAQEEVMVIKERKFSFLKTAGLPIILAGTALGILAITVGPDFDLDIDYMQN
ncbi:hypothetical protein [Ulvibacterium marinum]|uniref:hypothetical protein n=1 Tax=Ulvibacterium marinum TaxID=2419782 RepID=UPI002494E41E|nr:hypothetical protein [Ulvibacterium marinum]